MFSLPLFSIKILYCAYIIIQPYFIVWNTLKNNCFRIIIISYYIIMLICKNCIFAKKIITYRYIIVNIAKAQSVFTTLISVKVLLLQQNWFHLQIERINKKTGNKNKRIFRKKHIHPLKQPREYWGGCKKAFLRWKDKTQ